MSVTPFLLPPLGQCVTLSVVSHKLLTVVDRYRGCYIKKHIPGRDGGFHCAGASHPGTSSFLPTFSRSDFRLSFHVFLSFPDPHPLIQLPLLCSLTSHPQCDTLADHVSFAGVMPAPQGQTELFPLDIFSPEPSPQPGTGWVGKLRVTGATWERPSGDTL